MSKVQELLDEIKNFDCDPSVFTVFLKAANHISGYDAFLDFRATVPGSLDQISAHADTPEDALQFLRDNLVGKFGKCPDCGQYRHPKG
jgi:hypothetical protein